MAADPITPSRAAAFSNTLPSISGVGGRIQCVGRIANNMVAFTPISATYGTTVLSGTAATASSRLMLLDQQTDQTQNGIYECKNGGASVTVTGPYDSNGQIVKTGLTVGKLYWYSPGANQYVNNGSGGATLTEDGFITPDSSGNLYFRGPNSGTYSSLFVEASLGRSTLFSFASQFIPGLQVHVNAGPSVDTWYALTSTVTAVGTSVITFAQSVAAAITAAVNSVATFDNTAPTAITPGRATAFDNTSATSITVPPFH